MVDGWGFIPRKFPGGKCTRKILTRDDLLSSTIKFDRFKNMSLIDEIDKRAKQLISDLNKTSNLSKVPLLGRFFKDPYLQMKKCFIHFFILIQNLPDDDFNLYIVLLKMAKMELEALLDSAREENTLDIDSRLKIQLFNNYINEKIGALQKADQGLLFNLSGDNVQGKIDISYIWLYFRKGIFEFQDRKSFSLRVNLKDQNTKLFVWEDWNSLTRVLDDNENENGLIDDEKKNPELKIQPFRKY